MVRGRFDGEAVIRGEMIVISGSSVFEFSDIFEAPLGLGVEVGGAPYAITGEWSATFSAEVLRDPRNSLFRGQ